MSKPRLIWVGVLAIWIAGGLQQGIADKVSLFGALPDYLLLAACLLGLLVEPPVALVMGFAAGLIQGAVVGQSMWQFVVTRMAAAWLCSFLAENRLQRNIGSAAIMAVICTIICNLVFMIIALQSNIGSYLKATIITAVYNGVLALLAYVPLERAAGVKSQSL